MTQKDFIHPLSTLETIDTDDGKKEVINSWAFASILWSNAVNDNVNALGMVNELFKDKEELARLLEGSKAGDGTATRSAIAILAFAIDDKLTETFESLDQHKQENQ